MSAPKKPASKKEVVLPRGISMQNGSYRVRMFFEGRQLGLGSFSTLADANAALTIAKSEKVRGIFVPPKEIQRKREEQALVDQASSISLRQWCETWMRLLRARDLSEATIVSYRSTLNVHILPYLGDKVLRTITPDDIEELVDRVRATPSKMHPGAKGNGVTPNVVRTLRACFNAALKRPETGLVLSPVRVEAPPRAVRPKDPKGDVATPAEVSAMVAAMPEHLGMAVYLAAWCSMRLGEVLGLQRHDLEHLQDPNRALIHIRRQVNSKTPGAPLTAPKSDSVRSIAIPEFLLTPLQDHLERFTGDNPESPVITNPTAPTTRVSQTQLDNAWRAARKVAGRPVFRFHDLRHTGLTLYAQQGATMAELLHRGGHTDIEVALRYQHATAERDRALTAKLSQTIQG